MKEPELWLRPSHDTSSLVDAYVARHGRVALAGLLDGLTRRARPDDDLPEGAAWGLRWDTADDLDPHWFPQGLAHSGEATDDGLVEGRELLWSAAYRRGPRGTHLGTRLSLVDLSDDGLPYDHVHLAQPWRNPLTQRVHLLPVLVHAGGLAWHGRSLLVADTWGGFRVFDVDDVVAARGWWRRRGRYVLVQRARYSAGRTSGTPWFHHSFASVDRASTPHRLLTGEYRRSTDTRAARLMAYALDDSGLVCHDGRAVPVDGPSLGVAHMQGVAVVDGTTYVSRSRGAHRPGSLCWREPGDEFREIFGLLSAGCEDLSYDPRRRALWCQGEYPGQRHVYAVPRPEPTARDDLDAEEQP